MPRKPVMLAAGQTGGAVSADVIAVPPGWAGPPLHVHHSHEKTFMVLAGRLACQSGERRIVGGAGRALRRPEALAA